MKRFLQFVRSVLPGDLAQLWLLGGALSLFIAPNLRWAPWGFHAQLRVDSALRASVFGGLALVYFSGCAGLLVCLRPGRHPLRRLLSWACLPAALGIGLMCGFYVHTAALSSLSWDSIGLRNQAHSPLAILSKLGPGFHYSLIGLLLVAGFTVKSALRSASLPLALPKTSASSPDNQHRRHRVWIFLWVFAALLPALRWAFPFLNLNFIYYFARGHIPAFGATAAVSAQLFVTEAILLLIAIWIIGGEAWHELRRSLRWSPAWALAVATAFPVGIAVLISSGQFLFSLFVWAARQPDRIGPPQVASYFRLPGAGLLWFLPFALCEEIIFRGILQPLFVRRYGVLRGIFLVGIAFGAGHLNQDFSVGYTDGLVIAKLFARLFGALALSFVAGWLTLRARSVLPAAVAHGLMNILGGSPLGPTLPWIGPLIDLLWAASAYVLFRYWPIRSEAVVEAGQIVTTPASVT